MSNMAFSENANRKLNMHLEIVNVKYLRILNFQKFNEDRILMETNI